MHGESLWRNVQRLHLFSRDCEYYQTIGEFSPETVELIFLYYFFFISQTLCNIALLFGLFTIIVVVCYKLFVISCLQLGFLLSIDILFLAEVTEREWDKQTQNQVQTQQ